MKHSDVEELARKVGLLDPRDVWADLPSDYRQALCSFSELVLEKAAEVCDAEANNWDDDKGLSAEDRFTVLAYYALKDLAVAQKTILEHVLITPNPFFTAAQSTTTVGREG